jgi:hypothetical protein
VSLTAGAGCMHNAVHLVKAKTNAKKITLREISNRRHGK